MEERGWILKLPEGAGDIHVPTKMAASPKRKHALTEGQENVNSKKPKVIKEGRKLPIVKTKRTILGDIVNNLS